MDNCGHSIDSSQTTDVEHAFNMAQNRVNELKSSFPGHEADQLQGALHSLQQQMFELDRNELSSERRKNAESIVIKGANITANKANRILLELAS